jgi:hypothetical protein
MLDQEVFRDQQVLLVHKEHKVRRDISVHKESKEIPEPKVLRDQEEIKDHKDQQEHKVAKDQEEIKDHKV